MCTIGSKSMVANSKVITASKNLDDGHVKVPPRLRRKARELAALLELVAGDTDEDAPHLVDPLLVGVATIVCKAHDRAGLPRSMKAWHRSLVFMFRSYQSLRRTHLDLDKRARLIVGVVGVDALDAPKCFLAPTDAQVRAVTRVLAALESKTVISGQPKNRRKEVGAWAAARAVASALRLHMPERESIARRPRKT